MFPCNKEVALPRHKVKQTTFEISVPIATMNSIWRMASVSNRPRWTDPCSAGSTEWHFRERGLPLCKLSRSWNWGMESQVLLLQCSKKGILDQCSHATSTTKSWSSNTDLHVCQETHGSSQPKTDNCSMGKPFHIIVVQDHGSPHASKANNDWEQCGPYHEEIGFPWKE